MMESIKITCAEHTWAILLMLLGAFLLGLLLGYLLWYGYKRLVAGLEADKAALNNRIGDLEKDIASLKYKLDECEKDKAALRLSLNSCEADKAILQNKLDAGTAATGIAVGKGMTAAGDNLQIIEGIGPKIETVLHAAGIKTWASLSKKTFDELRAILDDAGSQFKINDPTTWPRQAELAADGKWDELIQYQKFLDTGSESKGDFDTPSKYEKMMMKDKGKK